MPQNNVLRLAVVLAGLMGAAGVALAAAAAHQPDATRLASGSSMLLFHASAVIGAVLLTAHGLARRSVGLVAIYGFIVGAALFSGDLASRQYAGHGLFTMAAPTGGTIMLLSWLVLALATLLPKRTA